MRCQSALVILGPVACKLRTVPAGSDTVARLPPQVHTAQGNPAEQKTAPIRPAQLIETNPLNEYQFVGSDGERITSLAAPLFATLGRLAGPETAQFFAISNFNDNRTLVTWFGQRKGRLEPFWEIADQRQHAVIEQLSPIALKVTAASQRLNRLPASESETYARLLPLLPSFPEPVEYHLYLIDGNPVATHWGMSKEVIILAQETLIPLH